MNKLFFVTIFAFVFNSHVNAGSCDDPLKNITDRLTALVPANAMIIPREKARQLTEDFGLSVEELMMALVPVAKKRAKPPISNYFVGAVGRGAQSGNLILGVNLEFPGHALNQTVHGEQFVVSQALTQGEKGIDTIALSAAPCGHCRQWLNETYNGGKMRVLVPGQSAVQLQDLLPSSFGPADLGLTASLLNHDKGNLDLENFVLQKPTAPELVQRALDAANQSYAPYSGNRSGVAVLLKDGRIFSGSYAENAAFNPSLSPLQVALVNLVAGGADYADIQRAVLVEDRSNGKVSQAETTRILLQSIAPDANLRIYEASENQ